MKKLKIILVCFVIVCVGLFYYFSTHYQRIQGLDNFPRTNVKAYVYETSVGNDSEHIQIDQADYESFLKIISSIKYMNPKFDPDLPENMIFGSSDYKLEINHIEDNSKTIFFIRDYEFRSNQRIIYYSDWDTAITAYVKDDVYKEYERLAKKYIKDSEDSENES
ncbi:hypothetical protein [Anaerotignum sp.]|uniref:hypothetical protein n=1 Tax=Anaerotignum sp. TaxID=2039241 RepID=UPI0027147355|nr:hypothetical protein [Anaerotignum sp.]